MKRDMKRALIVFLCSTILGVLVVAWVAFAAWRYGDKPSGTARGRVEIEIPKGVTAGEVATLLNKAGLIDRPTIFRLYAGQRGAANRFKAGHYVIFAPATPKQMLDVLVKGAADELVSVTVPPGKNLVEVAEIFDAAGICTKNEFLVQATDQSFVTQLGLPPSIDSFWSRTAVGLIEVGSLILLLGGLAALVHLLGRKMREAAWEPGDGPSRR